MVSASTMKRWPQRAHHSSSVRTLLKVNFTPAGAPLRSMRIAENADMPCLTLNAPWRRLTSLPVRRNRHFTREA